MGKPPDPIFLTVDEVIAFHADQIREHGGSAGVRDMESLKSAIAVPTATFAGEFVHGDLFEMASAYLFHVCSNHAFVDGNKRVAAVSALVFLKINGVEMPVAHKEYEDLVMRLAKGKLEKSDLAVFLRKKASMV